MVQWKQIQIRTIRLWVQSLALLSGLRIWHCRELWCRLQTRLGSCVAVAQPAVVALIGLLAWELPYAAGTALKSQKKKKKSIGQNKSHGPN